MKNKIILINIYNELQNLLKLLHDMKYKHAEDIARGVLKDVKKLKEDSDGK